MRSTASRILSRLSQLAAVAALSSLVLGGSPARAGEPPSSMAPGDPFADRFPNLVLRTHEGRNVRFYDDLLKDKIVLINFMYATCKER